MKSKRLAQILLLTFLLAAYFSQCKEDSDTPVYEDKLRGSTVDTFLHSSGLEGNLLGDSPNRRVQIYLPPGYEDDQSKRYPVIYFLHGYTENATEWYSDFLIS